MKTVVKIDPEKEYNLAKAAIASIGQVEGLMSDAASLDGAVDNLKTVINVLIERATPKPRIKPPKKERKSKPARRETVEKLPSERFPDLEIKEEVLSLESPPSCPCCGSTMMDSGLYKTSEKLEVIPKCYYIRRLKRVVYRCGVCDGAMVNSPAKPSIIPSSNYGDSVIIDASLSKYCDLIPMERYAAMARRDGLGDIPPNSLIGLTHSLADFLKPVSERIQSEVQSDILNLVDETPHKMLEGDDKSNWYLWGFACPTACIFLARDTRSGDVAKEFLRDSQASYLVTDGYAGYPKALRELAAESQVIIEINCNAHAYRYFRDASHTWKSECQDYLELYGQIYELERNAHNEEARERARQEMKPLFAEIERKCRIDAEQAMPKSSFLKAVQYFLGRVEALTRCCDNIVVPLDNNFSERLLRSPVVGRKTWYGTHSKRGARTSAALFSIVESCKLNSVNPRNYFLFVTQAIHEGSEILTPSEYAARKDV